MISLAWGAAFAGAALAGFWAGSIAGARAMYWKQSDYHQAVESYKAIVDQWKIMAEVRSAALDECREECDKLRREARCR